jgi:hypothetical protein
VVRVLLVLNCGSELTAAGYCIDPDRLQGAGKHPCPRLATRRAQSAGSRLPSCSRGQRRPAHRLPPTIASRATKPVMTGEGRCKAEHDRLLHVRLDRRPQLL